MYGPVLFVVVCNSCAFPGVYGVLAPSLHTSTLPDVAEDVLMEDDSLRPIL